MGICSSILKKNNLNDIETNDIEKNLQEINNENIKPEAIIVYKNLYP